MTSSTDQGQKSNNSATVHIIESERLSQVHKIKDITRDFEFPGAPRDGFRWIHIPSNNKHLVNLSVYKCLHAMYPSKLRPVLSQFDVPYHSMHMEASYTINRDTGDRYHMLYLPYMSWEIYAVYKELCKQCDIRTINMNDVDDNLMHPRRTLDQFYYPSSTDTSKRDADQTISKWTGRGLVSKGRETAADDSYMIMIDQLWCFVAGDNTIISSFPATSTYVRHSNLYNSIQCDARYCKDIWDFQSLLVRKVTRHLFAERKQHGVDLIETYRWATREKAASQTSCSQEFHMRHTNKQLDQTAFDDSKESQLVLEVSDIIDELNMIKHLVQTQIDVVRKLEDGMREMKEIYSDERGRAFDTTACSAMNTYKELEQQVVDLDSIKTEAEYTHKMLHDLLDLKSKTASLAETRTATKQGQAVMLFTIVTVIFLPLSFFTSYFGQNVSEITGDGNNPSSWDLWKIATPISVVIIVLALIISLLIMRPDFRNRLRFWRRSGRLGHEQDNVSRLESGTATGSGGVEGDEEAK